MKPLGLLVRERCLEMSRRRSNIRHKLNEQGRSEIIERPHSPNVKLFDENSKLTNFINVNTIPRDSDGNFTTFVINVGGYIYVGSTSHSIDVAINRYIETAKIEDNSEPTPLTKAIRDANFNITLVTHDLFGHEIDALINKSELLNKLSKTNPIINKTNIAYGHDYAVKMVDDEFYVAEYVTDEMRRYNRQMNVKRIEKIFNNFIKRHKKFVDNLVDLTKVNRIPDEVHIKLDVANLLLPFPKSKYNEAIRVSSYDITRVDDTIEMREKVISLIKTYSAQRKVVENWDMYTNHPSVLEAIKLSKLRVDFIDNARLGFGKINTFGTGTLSNPHLYMHDRCGIYANSLHNGYAYGTTSTYSMLRVVSSDDEALKFIKLAAQLKLIGGRSTIHFIVGRKSKWWGVDKLKSITVNYK